MGGAHDEDVRSTSEGIVEDCAGLEVDLGVVTWGLASRGTVVVPDGKIIDGGGGGVEGPGL